VEVNMRDIARWPVGRAIAIVLGVALVGEAPGRDEYGGAHRVGGWIRSAAT
jgi:hypothetical protein